jgi:hypothetical protein
VRPEPPIRYSRMMAADEMAPGRGSGDRIAGQFA